MVTIEVLNHDAVEQARRVLAAAPFRDGRLTAGAAARDVKDNEQAAGDHPDIVALTQDMRRALQDHPTFRSWVRPVRWSKFLFSRYNGGHRYGPHTDDASIADEYAWPLRTDLSFTLFLSNPDTYDGGELRLRDAGGERVFKPAAGAAVVYATGVVHEVAPVTRGTRLACVGWVQSQIRRADQRELLFDLDRVRKDPGAGDSALLLDKTIGNLLRMWGEN